MDEAVLIGRQLGNYRLERILGQGGMSTVYYAVDVKLLRPAAVKVYDTRSQVNPDYAQRIIQEARAIAKWRHENIVDIYYADDQDGLYYFAMEYIDGLDLARVLKRYELAGELVPQADVIRIGSAIASALDYAHHKGVIHRDVKPSNVFVERSGRLVLGDFGVAQGLHADPSDEVFGTARYIAPEQASHPSIAVPQSDLYALGVLLYEMLTGQPPFDGPSPTEVALQHVHQPPPAPRALNPALNERTQEVLIKALSKDPAARYPSGAELMEALEEALHQPGEPVLQTASPGLALSPTPVNQVVADSTSEAPTQGIYLPDEALPASPENPASQPPVQGQPASHWMWPGIGCAVLTLAAMITMVVVLIILLSQNTFPLSAAPSQSPTATTRNTQTGGMAATPTPFNQGGSLAAPTQASTAAPASISASQRFVAYYNENSFYLLEADGIQNPITNIRFERLDAQNVALNTWAGARWAQFYPVIRPGACVRIEILSSQPYLRPPQCQTYYSTRTPIRTDPGIFWTASAGSTQFRVMWQGQEVQRCNTGSDTCEFQVP